MKKTVFENEDYKTYLRDWLKGQDRGGHGKKSAMAEAIRCQAAYVSQVLGGPGNFSLEQADLLNSYLGHGEAEADFFLLLVQRERAGSRSLRDHFTKAIEKVRAERKVLKERLKIANGMGEADRSRYYGDWRYAAVHILLTIPAFQNRQAIARRLGLGVAAVAEILEFLVRTGLAESAGDSFTVTNARIHLGQDSPEIQKHHTNWRIRAMGSFERETPAELHYTSVVSLSESDRAQVRETLMKTIEEVKARVKESPEEELCAFCLDFFRV